MPMLPAAPLEWAGAQVTDFGEGLKTETRCFKVCIATVASIVNAVVWCCMRTALRFGRLLVGLCVADACCCALRRHSPTCALPLSPTCAFPLAQSHLRSPSCRPVHCNALCCALRRRATALYAVCERLSPLGAALRRCADSVARCMPLGSSWAVCRLAVENSIKCGFEFQSTANAAPLPATARVTVLRLAASHGASAWPP